MPEPKISEAAVQAIKHCPCWFRGGEQGCHYCGHFPSLQRLLHVLGMGPKPVAPECKADHDAECDLAGSSGVAVKP